MLMIITYDYTYIYLVSYLKFIASLLYNAIFHLKSIDHCPGLDKTYEVLEQESSLFAPTAENDFIT